MLFFPNPHFAKIGPTVVTTGWRFPGSTGQIGSSPQVVWGSTANIMADGGVFAISELNYYGKSTYSLRANNFNFAAESIPSGAVIVGFEVEIGRNFTLETGDPTFLDGGVSWTNDYTASTVQGVNMASPDAWPQAENTAVPGTPKSYSWSIPAYGALTKAILEATNFAVLVSARRPLEPGDEGSGIARVDYVKCRATYYVS